tara:strand:- start:603 stop:2720 length:2118 start_codon:yes stop_codon:yes gene_type:complete
MTVNHEIKSHLAKLLATEDLVVEHRYVETAQFNVHSRVLTLPMWEKASSIVYDMLVGHEVGHALYTPDRDWLLEKKISPQVVNIVEDVRIEKLMKRRYAGISKTFYRGYNELADEDFFALENENIELMSLADRINLYFKIGSFVDIKFKNFEEKDLVKKVSDCETFDDVLNVAEELYNFCKSEAKQEQPKNDAQQQSGVGGGESDGQPESNDFESVEPEEGESYGGTAQQQSQVVDGDENQGDDLDLKTVDSLEDAIKELASMDGFENVYTELPQINLENIIIPNAEIHQRFAEAWDEYEGSEIFDSVDEEYLKFKKSAQKEVNYLVKEFECRKAADSYARATTARTGVLDCTKLHTYKYNEDLFKKVTTLADGKNHGLIFLLDWSGSMGDVMLDTVKQMFNLVWFCKKVGIPFEVYAFTNDYPVMIEDDAGYKIPRPTTEKKPNTLAFTEWFSLMNLLTSKTKTKELEKQIHNIYRLARYFRRGYNYGTYPCPVGMSLSGTPLNEALVCLHSIIPEFKKENGLQKVQCVVLSDGEANPLTYYKEIHRFWEDKTKEPYIGTGRLSTNSFLRDRKTGNTYSFDCEWYAFTDIILRNLKDNFSDVNFIGIRVLEPRDAKSFIRRYCGAYGSEYNRVELSWRKQRAFSIKGSGYSTYFGMSANSLSQSSEFDVDEGATKSKIKSAFVKSLKSKKMNKKVLNEFIELIA